jgi:hypothetical protein
MVRDTQYRNVLDAISAWPVPDRIALAQDVLGTITRSPVTADARPSFEAALGIGRGEGPPPTDEEVRHWIDEHRTGKYSR